MIVGAVNYLVAKSVVLSLCQHDGQAAESAGARQHQLVVQCRSPPDGQRRAASHLHINVTESVFTLFSDTNDTGTDGEDGRRLSVGKGRDRRGDREKKKERR